MACFGYSLVTWSSFDLCHVLEVWLLVCFGGKSGLVYVLASCVEFVGYVCDGEAFAD